MTAGYFDMVHINPHAVVLPDGRVGRLVARMGLQGCIEVGTARIVETCAISALQYFCPSPERGEHWTH